ncbi:MAG TPA: methyl-accepting chemotaxis protein [Candidatus Agathobaculum pullicola]|nr:methyl-accepting chemotaxis protein [Candidatus Agathobaculum pullicola]
MKKAVKQSTLLTALNLGTIALVIVLGISFLLSAIMSNLTIKMYSDGNELTSAAQQFLDAAGYLTEQARACAATGEATYHDNYQNEVYNLQNRTIGYDRMKEIGLTAEEDALIIKMLQLSNTLVPMEESAMSLAMNGDIPSALEYVFGEAYSTDLMEIESLQAEFVETFQARLASEIEKQEASMLIIRIMVTILVILIIAFQIFSTLFTRKKVIRPLKIIQREMIEFSKGNLSVEGNMKEDTSELGMLVYSVHQMQQHLKEFIDDIRDKLLQIAQGDLDIQMNISYIGDLAEIETSMKQISTSLSDAFREIDLAANQVALGSEQVSHGAQALSQGATQQASAVEELAATIQEINARISQNAKDTDSANNLTMLTGTKVNESKQKMQELMSAMDEIKQTSQQIQGIIKTIDDIAFQTNILALNAAVEAARAGAAGKGFAVVADEVRNLAGKSAKASQNTQELIKNAIYAVEQGGALATDAAKVLNETAAVADEVVASIKRIATASAEQAQAADQIAQGLDQVSSVVQTNSATAEESAAASEELSGQSSMLKTLVGKFNIANGSTEYEI